MSYTFDNYDRSLVINGFENGIADSPFAGISDMRNVNIIPIPGEASVNFSTILDSTPTASFTVLASATIGNGGPVQITGSTGIPNQMSVVFAGGGLPAGLVAGTRYWLLWTGSGNNYTVYSDYFYSTLVNITGNGSGTMTVFNTTHAFKYIIYGVTGYWAVDSAGFVWTNEGGLAGFTYTGNTTHGSGNGLVYYKASDTTRFIFVFGNSQIDYIKLTGNGTPSGGWVYGWKPSDGTTGNSSYLKDSGIHEALVAPDNKVYYCDGSWIGRWYQADRTVPFVPTTPSTYVFDTTAVLPFNDTAQCLAPLGNNILIGGVKNVIYPWDTFSQVALYPILLAESNVQKMITVNTNTYALVGNRGRIYYTNGSQAQLFKKMPDHISGTVEPYYTWGGLASQKNQIYFSASVTTNGGAAINQYGGVWAIDVDTKAIRLTNKLSYGTYAGYATAIAISPANTPSGTGLEICWDSGASTYGIDTTSSNPYTNSEAVIVSDLVPIGTFQKPRDLERLEYRLTKPMVAGESINIYARLIFNTTDTGFGTAILSDNTAGNFSNSSPVNFKNAQWLQFMIVLNSTTSSPTYTRLKEIRVTGLQGQGPLQQISL